MSKESFFSKDNAFTKTIAKKMATVALISSLTLGNAGCNQKPIEVVNDPTTPITDVNKEPTTPTNPSTPDTKPVPNTPETPVETKTPRQLELEALLVKAPEVAGLTKAIEGDKIIYQNENKEKSGYYVEKAYYNDQETDGISLSASVIDSIIKENLNQGKEGCIPIPVDPNEGQIVSVNFQQTMQGFEKTFNFGAIFITTNSAINLVNFYSSTRLITEVRYSIKNGTNLPALNTNDGIENNVKEGDYYGNIGIFLNEGNFYRLPTSPTFSSTYGEVLGEIDNQIFLVKYNYDYTKKIESLNLYEDKILTINKSIVFLMANQTK